MHSGFSSICRESFSKSLFLREVNVWLREIIFGLPGTLVAGVLAF